MRILRILSLIASIALMLAVSTEAFAVQGDMAWLSNMRDMLKRFESSKADCHKSDVCEELALWNQQVDSLRGKDTETVALSVNSFFNNAVTYEAEGKSAGGVENNNHATPLEILKEGFGDCEDYAFAKYLMLKELGVRGSNLSVLFVKLKKNDEGHALVAVVDGDVFLGLDNRSKNLLSSSDFKEAYRFYFLFRNFPISKIAIENQPGSYPIGKFLF